MPVADFEPLRCNLVALAKAYLFGDHARMSIRTSVTSSFFIRPSRRRSLINVSNGVWSRVSKSRKGFQGVLPASFSLKNQHARASVMRRKTSSHPNDPLRFDI